MKAMTMPVGQMMVSVRAPCACVKIAGRVTFTSSLDFKALLNELLRQGFTRFVIDLSECVLMDSTFLGVLASFGLKFHTPQPDLVQRSLDLFNPSERVMELLDTLGVLELFHVVRGETAPTQDAEARALTPTNPTREEVKRNCLEAHELLMAVNPANIARFKDVAAFLTEDLKKNNTPG